MNDLISVIVPIYRVEDYLDQCIKSIVNQTYKNLEIILVDDGSPDNCPVICDDWLKKDNRIRVIHKSNGGLSDARNAGLYVANGNYISFVDSDDLISLEFYEILLKYMKKKGLDIIECKRFNFDSESQINEYTNTQQDIEIFSAESALEELILDNKIHQTVWNKLYKTDIVKDLRFEIGKINEDEFYTYLAIGNCHSFGYLDIPLYYYRQRQNSIMKSDFSLKKIDGLEGRYRRYLYIKQHYPLLNTKAGVSVINHCIYLGQLCLKTRDKNIINNCFYKVNEYYKDIINDIKSGLIEYSFREKKWILLSRISLKLCCHVKNILNIGL